jgi:hypothetical protein
MRRAMLISLLFPVAAFAGGLERWPAALRDLPSEVPAKLTYRGFAIQVQRPTDPSIRAGGGSGGPTLAFTVRTPSGRAETFDEQSIGVRLLELYHGYRSWRFGVVLVASATLVSCTVSFVALIIASRSRSLHGISQQRQSRV